MIKYFRDILIGFWSLLVGMRVTARNFMRKPVTLQYPWEKWTPISRFRGAPRVWDYYDANTINSKSEGFEGMPLPPCNSGCPAITPAREYVSLISERKYRRGVRMLKDHYPFSGVLGRVCSAPCERHCNREIAHGNTLSIRQLKRFLADWNRALPPAEREPLQLPAEKPVAKNKKVAIVGAGPAGLMAACELARMGYHSVVFEKFNVPGGYLWTGIPIYRLPRYIIQEEVQDIIGLGYTEIRYGTVVGKDVPFDELYKNHDAVFIGIGATKPMKLGCPGEDLEGVLAGEDFLEDVNLDRGAEIGKKVAVIGGGNTAMDCARTALRMGAETAILYRRTRKEMPAGLDEIEDCHEEGVDMKFLVAPVEVIGEGGKVTGIKMVKNKLGKPDASGRRRPIEIKGSEFVYPCDTILTAISRKPVMDWLEKEIKISAKWGTIEVNEETMMTSKPGVFAGGDDVLGAATVIEAIAQGKRAAKGIHGYLSRKESERPMAVQGAAT